MKKFDTEGLVEKLWSESVFSKASIREQKRILKIRAKFLVKLAKSCEKLFNLLKPAMLTRYKVTIGLAISQAKKRSEGPVCQKHVNSASALLDLDFSPQNHPVQSALIRAVDALMVDHGPVKEISQHTAVTAVRCLQGAWRAYAAEVAGAALLQEVGVIMRDLGWNGSASGDGSVNEVDPEVQTTAEPAPESLAEPSTERVCGMVAEVVQEESSEEKDEAEDVH